MNVRYQNRGLTRLMVVVLAAAVAGCEAEPIPGPRAALPAELTQKHPQMQEVPVAHVVRRDYRLREGDFLEIIYHVRHRRAESYNIKIQDVIVIRFPFNPNLSQTEQVQSDGTLRLDLVGPCRA